MLRAFQPFKDTVQPLPHDARGLDAAIWIDLETPTAEQVAAVEALGVRVPRQEDMQGLQISNRLYHMGDTRYLTVVLPGLSAEGRRKTRPLCMVLSAERLVTVRYHAPGALTGFAERAGQTGAGCATPMRLCLGLIEEMVDELSDSLEAIGQALDATATEVFEGERQNRGQVLQDALETTGRFGVRLGAVRHSLLTLARAVNYLEQFPQDGGDAKDIKRLMAGQSRDIAALEVHVDYLSSRASVTADATLGMISLEQNRSVSLLSALVALFAPAMLIASVYGMNFTWLPGLESRVGVAVAVGTMVVSGLLTFLFFRKRGWM